MRAKRSVLWTGRIFLVVGLLLVGVGGSVWWGHQHFQSAAVRAEGEVIELEWRGRTARPIVRFQADGKTLRVRGKVASSPPAFHPGERVQVLYLLGKPENARIDSFSENYLVSLILGAMGLIFSLIGASLILGPALLKGRREKILAGGRPIQAKVVAIHLKTGVEVNGRSPWVIVAEYRDDRTGKIETATSHNLWENPETAYPPGSAVTLYYLVDRPAAKVFRLDRLPESK